MWSRESHLKQAFYCNTTGAGIAQPVQPLATAWMVRGSNPDGGETFRTRPSRLWDPPNLLYYGYRVSFLGVKRPGRGVDHPPPSSTEVEGRVELYICFSSGPSWPVLWRTLPYLYLYRYSNPNRVCVTFMYCVSIYDVAETKSNATYRTRSTVGIMVNAVQETAKYQLWLEIWLAAGKRRDSQTNFET